jgi:hypothetical protein
VLCRRSGRTRVLGQPPLIRTDCAVAIAPCPLELAARLGLARRFSAPGGGAAGSVVGRARVADELGAPRGPLPIPGGVPPTLGS